MIRWVMFIITVISCAYAVYCQWLLDVYKKGFILLAKVAYNPKNEQDVIRIIERIQNESIRNKKADNR